MKINWKIILILVGIGILIGGFSIFSMRAITRQAISPLQEAGSSLQTQVAQVLHPTPTILPDPITILHQVGTIARLETIQYSMEKIITAEVGQEVFGILFGDQLLLVAHADVIAGVDLSKLSSEDIVIKDGVLTIKIPEAEVFTVVLDNERSYVYDRRTGLLTKGNKDLETQARQAAEEQILLSALEDGILEQAQVNAEAFLLRFLHNLGFDSIIFTQ